jgi:hypothetical protein
MALPACPHRNSVKMNASMEDWQNDTELGKLKQLEKKLSQCHFVHHKYHTDRPALEPGC